MDRLLQLFRAIWEVEIVRMSGRAYLVVAVFDIGDMAHNPMRQNKNKKLNWMITWGASFKKKKKKNKLFLIYFWTLG